MNQILRKRRFPTSPHLEQNYATLRNAAFVIFLFLHSWLLSTTITIKQDGSGDFTTIQAGIDASSDGDTILVHPGTYYENLIIEAKSITLGSLYMTTNDESYIGQTKLDGFYNGCVLNINDTAPQEVVVCGFVIQHGTGVLLDTFSDSRKGGGMYIDDSNVIIKKCFIEHNNASGGGGIYAFSDTELTLIGNTIRYNTSLDAAGGMFLGWCSNALFNSNYRNSIYLNYSGYANDIMIASNCPFQEIIVDTFTVSDPDEGYYFIYPNSGGAGVPQPGIFSFECQHSVLQQINHDLYVSPDGDDTNSGASPAEPLQSIAFALAKIHSDSLFHKTIYLANGVYSPSINNQFFPLHLKSYVDLIGESREETILDAESLSGHIKAYDPQHDYSVENLWLKDARYDSNIRLTQNTEARYKNIIFTNSNTAYSVGHSINASFSDLSVSDVIVKDIFGSPAIYLYTGKTKGIFNVTNYEFSNNYCDGICRALRVYRHTVASDSLVTNLVNAKITENLNATSEWLPADVAILVDVESKINVVNCTIGNNTVVNSGAAIRLADQSEANITNTILYGDTPAEFCLDGTYGPCTLNVKNSLVDGGMWGIMCIGANTVNWDEATVLDADPLWLGSGDYPYMLSQGSPCIDAGTLDLPAGIELPEFDLAGNPRISGDGIDMGAYEYQDSTAVEPPLPQPPARTSITNYPTPFRPSASRSGGTTIMLELVEEGPITVDIYNIKGQKVLNLMDSTTVPGTFKFTWNGTDADNRPVASGQYFVKVVQKGRTTASKMMVIK